jgi:predicted FMN-binding regulatory protein PaiB
LLDEFAEPEWFATVDRARRQYPTWDIVAAEWQSTSDAKQQEFLCGVANYVVLA